MNNKLVNVIIFSVGVAVGSVITWKVMKNKYEQYEYEEEFEEDDCSDDDEDIEDDSEQDEKPASINYNGILNNLKYTETKDATHSHIDDCSDDEESDEEDNREESDNMGYGPYVIPPEEFDENGYETESLTLFSDGVLVDSYNEIIDDIDDLVGLDSLEHFGEFEDDSVFVRNDDLQRDYEILRDYRTYSEAFADR